MQMKTKKILLLLVAAGLSAIIYILLHEIGHLIVMLSVGATITDFSILTAHVSATGGEYTTFSKLWLHANGALLPMIVAFIYSIFYKSDCKKLFYCLFSYMFVLIPTCSMLAWVFIPILYLGGNAPVNDDVTKFLYDFTDNFYPLTVSVVAAAIIGCSIILMIKKRIIQNYIAESK